MGETFLTNLVKVSVGYNVRLVFDLHMQGSLKEKMKEKVTTGSEIQYHVDDRMIIFHYMYQKLVILPLGK